MGARRMPKRHHLTRKTAKVVNNTLDVPSGLTYCSVRRELREEPHPSKRGKQYLTRTHFFNLLFLMQFEDDNDMKQGWKILPHLHSLRTARKRLEPDDFDYLVDEMRWIFEEYCLFIRSVSRNR